MDYMDGTEFGLEIWVQFQKAADIFMSSSIGLSSQWVSWIIWIFYLINIRIPIIGATAFIIEMAPWTTQDCVLYHPYVFNQNLMFVAAAKSGIRLPNLWEMCTVHIYIAVRYSARFYRILYGSCYTIASEEQGTDVVC